MYRSIKEVFDGEVSHFSADANLIKRLRIFESSFVGRNADHIEFFGGHLLGVNPVKFLPSDEQRWFEEIIHCDEHLLEEKLYALPTVNTDWIVSSNVLNISACWVVHEIFTSTKLNPQQKHQGMMDALLILQYKFFTSLLFHYFRYPAAPEVAEATFAALSDKFTIKQVGSWGALFRARAETILAKDSPHMENGTIPKMNSDEGVTYFLNDVQGRIRDVMKNIYAVYDQVHKSGIAHNTTSSVTDHDGEKILKDKAGSLMNYTRYLNAIVTDKPSFIRQDLVTVVEKLVHTAPPRVFEETLAWVSENYRKSNYGIIEQVLNETLIHSFAYFDEHREYVRGTPNLPDLLARLKGVYMSSRSTDPVLMKLRESAEQLVSMATKNKNDSVLASVRTALLLYLVARALTMSHYAG
jgi:hypothetical protein